MEDLKDYKKIRKWRQQALDKELKRVKGLAAKTYGQKENNYYGYEGILENYGDLLTELQKKAVKAKIDREQEVYWSGLDDAESSEWEELKKKWSKAE